jgi:hypothetical protein
MLLNLISDGSADCFSSEKQFKRKADGWGFIKNIPSREMEKMVKKRQRREEEQGKETSFKRTRNGDDFEIVAPAKLDRFQQRNGLVQADLMSISSGMSIGLCGAFVTDL